MYGQEKQDHDVFNINGNGGGDASMQVNANETTTGFVVNGGIFVNGFAIL